MFTIAKDTAVQGHRHRFLSAAGDTVGEVGGIEGNEAAASDFNKFDGFPFATQTQSSIRSKNFELR